MVFQEWTARKAMAEQRIRRMAELADKAKVSAAYIRLVFNGLYPSDGTRAKIAAALNVAEADLWKPARAE